MDDNSSSMGPMSDFLQSLSRSAVKTKEEEAKKDEAKAELKFDENVDSGTSAVPSGNATDSKVRVALKALKAIEQNVQNIIRLLETDMPPGAPMPLSMEPTDLNMVKELELAGIKQIDGRVTEGVFDGSGMVGSDGKVYVVPPNYASKSKLVEGDMLKLTITPKGSFIYKQIGPIERSRVMASLGFDPTNGEYYAVQEDKRWSVIKASVTYFKGEPGDEIVLLVPKNAPSKWGAVENVIKKSAL